MNRAPHQLLLTCEHGGNQVPRQYAQLFRGRTRLLDSHRALDRGAMELAQHLAQRLEAPLFYSLTTRLLVDLNRSIGHPRLFSSLTRSLSQKARQQLLQQHYLPYRRSVEEAIAQATAGGRRLLHVSVHTFTPVLKGQVRRTDIGLLYDPARSWERAIARPWQQAMKHSVPELVIRRNHPYRGISDGFTTHLRRVFDDATYAGIELEINRRWVKHPRWPKLQALLADTLLTLLGGEMPY